jgi:His-Xaa-Ser system protein HxsD
VVEAALSVPVDSSIYSVSAILRTAYWFTDRCYILVTRDEPGHYCVHFSPKPDEQVDLASLVGEFTNSLLDQQLRVELAAETRGVRELIVAKAFAEGDLLDDPVPGTDADPVEAQLDWHQLSGGKT